MPDFIIASNNQRWTGWKSIELIRSMEIGPDEFEVTLSSNQARDVQRQLIAGSEVTIYLDNELLMTGYIDDVVPEYDANSIDLIVRGRSKLGDLVDCSIAGQQFNNQSYLNVASALTRDFGIEIINDASNSTKRLRQPTLDEGQSIWEFIEREARALAFRLMSTPSGDLRLTDKPIGTSDSLVLGDNILSASATFSQRERYSDYTVMANQSRNNPLLNGDKLNLNKGTAKDNNVKRYRPLVILSDDDLDTMQCRTRASWQRNVHYGRGNEVVYTVSGWQQQNGSTWQTNTLSLVNDTVVGINTNRLIVEARMILDEDGERTELLVMPAEAMQLTELPIQKSNNGLSLSAGGN